VYNLLRFFVRYYLFILFISLEVFSFFLIYRNKKYNEAAYVNVANTVSGKLYKTYESGRDYLYLRRINDSLVAENAQLRELLPESRFNTRLDSLRLEDTVGKSARHFVFIAARVIRNSVNQPSNLIYLDKGRLQGITKQMGVINANGIAGQVISVTDNYSAAMSVLHKDFKVSAKLKKSEYFGNLRWDGLNSLNATLEEVPKHVRVQAGDTVVTSGYSELFPRNIMIGIVRSVKAAPDKNFLDISVALSTDFGNLSYVYIVKNLKRNELNKLDSLMNKND
jgi:rod shape-determining protein MreC